MRALFPSLALLAACHPLSERPGLVDHVEPPVSSLSDGADPLAGSADVLPGEFVVRAAPGVDASAVADALDGVDAAELEEVPGLPGTYRFRTTVPTDQVQDLLDEDGRLAWGEPRVRVTRFAADPNDTYYGYQWNLQLLQAPDVWTRSTGAGVTVAVVDTGVAPATDAYASLLPGMDFVDAGDGRFDPNGHGTHVAGSIAQGTNNSQGVAGLAPDAAILPVRVLDANGSGTSEDVAAGITWAVDHGADVINLSLGSNVYSQVIADACAHAEANDVVVFAASGNDGFADFVSYPAALASTIAVGASTYGDGLAPYSNGGAALDLVAPGGDVSQDANGDGYGDGILAETTLDGVFGYHFLNGTSMASPHAAAAGALLLADGVAAADVRVRLTSTAVDLGVAGFDDGFGHGRVDVLAALELGGAVTEPVGCGADRCGEDLSAGDLVVTELMANPTDCSDANGEWIEVHNATDGTVNLAGLVVRDASGREGAVSHEAALAPGGYAVLGKGDAQSFCGPVLDGSYGGAVTLNNGGDQVELLVDGQAVAVSVAWTDSEPGVSWALPVSAYDAPTDADWVLSTEAIPGTHELGTPGEASGEVEAAVLSIDQVWLDELVVTEFMANPAATSDTTGEWMELRNDSSLAIDLDGLEIRDEVGAGAVVGSLVVQPGERVLLGRGDAGSFDHPDVVPDGFYGDVSLNNSGDRIGLHNADGEIGATFIWTSSGGTPGVSMELVGADPRDAASWAKATSAMPSGDKGTPGL